MPYFVDQNLLDDEEKDPTQVQISGASPTSEKDGSLGGDASESSGKKDLNTGSGYQNLEKYLNTNESKQFGNQFIGKVQGEVDQAKEKQASAAGQFEQQVQGANATPTDKQVNDAIANPTGTNAQDFQKWQSQTYKGPHSLAESPNLQNQYWSGTNKANTSAQLLGNESGRFSLLDSYFGKPSYNFGQKSLDNLLVQQSGLGREKRDIQNQATELKAQGDAQAKQLQSIAGKKAAQVDQSRQGVRSAIGIDDQGNVITGAGAGALGKEYNQVQGDLAQKNAARNAEQSAMKEAIASGKFTDEQLKSLGLSRGQSLYNVGDLGGYLSTGAELNRNQTMTPEQRARIQALSQLSGVTDDFASGAATDPTSAYTFDKDRLSGDLKGAEALYNNTIHGIRSQINPLQVAYDQNKQVYNTYTAPERYGFRSKNPQEIYEIQNSAYQMKQLKDQIDALQQQEAAYTSGSGINRRIV